MSDDLAAPFNQPEQPSFQTLQARLSQLEAALVQVEQAIVCTDRHGQIEWCNPGFERLVSHSQAAMRQRLLLTVLPLKAEDAASTAPLVHPVQQAIAGQLPQPILYRFGQGDRAVMLQLHWSQAADQSWVFAIDRVDRQPTELAASETQAESETDRIAEAQLKQQEFLRMVIDTDPNHIFVKDREGHYLLVNKACANFYHLTVEEVLGKKIDDFVSDADLVAHFRSQNQWVIDQRQPLFISEETVNHPEVKWLQWQKQPIRLPDRDEYAVLGVGVNITDRKRSELALASILQGTASATGSDFFPVLVQNLVTALDVQYAIVTELINETQVGSLAFWANGQLQPNAVFELSANSCCQQVVDQGLVVCSGGARQEFPTAQIVELLAAESYLGVALRDAEGRTIGTLCILDTQPLRYPPEAEALLRIFAARAAAELERQRAIAALHQLNQELEARVTQRTQELQQSQVELQHQTQLLQTVLNSLGDGVAVIDKNNNLLVINPAACRILGIGEAENPANLQDQYAPYLNDRVTPYPPDQTPMHRAMRGEAADNVEVFLRRSDLPDRPGVLLDVSLGPLCNSAGEVMGGVVTFRDITQRRAIEDTLRQHEIALRDSEAQLRAIFENVPIAISLADISDNYRIVRRNAAHQELVGYSETEILRMTIADYTHPDDLDADLHQVQRILDGEISCFQMQKRYRRQTGEYIWVKLTGATVCDADGNPHYALGITEDITEVKQRETDRQRNEAALRKSETRLRRVIDSSMVGIFFSLSTGEITEANHSFLQMVGYTPEDVVAGRLRWDELTPPEYHAVNRLIDQELLLHQVSSIHEKEYLHQDGSRIPVLLGVTLIEDGHEVVFVLNISDRKQTERRLLVVQDQLLIAQERLQHLLCSSPAIIYSATPVEVPLITFISTNVSQVLGYEASECISTNFWLTHLHPDDLPTCRAGLVQLLQQGYVAIEYRFRHQDGSYRWLYDQSQLVRDETGNMLEQIGSWIDISERKRDEAERKRAEEQLHQINQRLALTNAELAHATRLKDEFLANMSHELRTPLNSIIGLSEVMQEEVFGALTAKQRQFLETIQSSGRHLLDLINDILDLAKIEAGMLELNLTETPIQALCEASLTLMRQQAIQKNITLRSVLLDPATLDPPPSPGEEFSLSNASADILHGTIRVDERRIRQVLINLLSNAIKFTPEGGIVTLTVHSTQDPSDQKYLSFSVTDTGIGIAPQDRHKLFQTFVQIDSSIARHYEGTGLGLALVKQITEMHNGQVSVESSLGLGSCFTITLPWIQVEEQTDRSYRRSAPSADSPARSPCCILLAESHPDSAATIADYLQIKNFEVILAQDGLAVIQQAIAHRPQLILMNLQLPKSSELPALDGLEVIRRIRAHPDTASIPLVVLTAAANLSEQASCLSVGANDYIAKPIRLKQLVSLIQTYVEIKDENQHGNP